MESKIKSNECSFDMVSGMGNNTGSSYLPVYTFYFHRTLPSPQLPPCEASQHNRFPPAVPLLFHLVRPGVTRVDIID